VVPDEAAEVAKMVDAIASGQSLRSVVRDLNVRGVPTATGNGSRWQSKTVREMLMRPRIAGLSAHHGKEVGTAKWLALVDETVWRTVVSILPNPARATADGERLGRGVSWLGSGIYVCGVCGGTLKVGTSGSTGRKTYRCKNRADDDRVHVTREATGLDEYVAGVIKDYWSKPGRVEKMLARDDSVDTKALRKELADINAEKDKLAVAHGKGQIDLGQLITGTKVFDDRAKAITKQLASVGWRSPVEPFAHGTVSDVWETLSLPQRRAILKVTAAFNASTDRIPPSSHPNAQHQTRTHGYLQSWPCAEGDRGEGSLWGWSECGVVVFGVWLRENRFRGGRVGSRWCRFGGGLAFSGVNGWVVVGCTGGVDGHHQRWRVRRLVRCGVVGVDHRQRIALPCSMRR
jgi:recombinase